VVVVEEETCWWLQGFYRTSRLAMNEVDAGGLHCNVDSQREFITSLL
jgi:hypothetical protein